MEHEVDYLNEYKELYYKELELKECMSSKIEVSITLITVICTGHLFLWNKMIALSIVFRIVPIIFALCEFLSCYFAVCCMIAFYKTYYNYIYSYINISSIDKDFKKNLAYKDTIPPEEIDNANYELLKNSFLKYTKDNRKENIRKNKNQKKLSSYIIKSIISLFITYLVWLILINHFK